MGRITICGMAGALALAAGTALAGETPAPEGAELYFIELEDGAMLTNSVTIRFG